MNPPSDTSREAQRVLTESYRAMAPDRKLRLLGQEYRLARSLHEAGFRRTRPRASRSEVRESWGVMVLGLETWKTVNRSDIMDDEMEPLAVLREVAGAFDALGIAYAVGGSWASSLYGEARMTRDADVSAEPFPGKERALAARFGGDYYVSVDAVIQAVRQRSTFNIIHTPSAFKVDVFVVKDDGFERSLLARRAAGPGPGSSENPLVWVSAEDITLLKLRWYRLGNEISDRQWSDVLGVLRTQAGRLDLPYLETWAENLGVADLLSKALGQASGG